VAELEKRQIPRWIVGALVVGAFGLGYWLHGQFNFDLSLEGLRGWIQSWGGWAPVLFVTVMTFRQFLFLPSLVLLSVGGFGFGVFWGTILGALGLFLSGMLTFGLGRGLAGEGMRHKIRARHPELEARIEKLGPWLVLLVMVYPGGPMTAVFWASGLTKIAVGPYALALSSGGLVRAFIYSFFGSSLVEGMSDQFLLISAGMLVVFLLPLCFSSVREMLGMGRR